MGLNIKAIGVKAAVLCFLLIVSCAPRQPFVPIGNGIQTDPALVSGRLHNGFQYLLMENPVPADRVFVYLTLFSGSLHETEEQQGVAHFLEHMLFNGSKHFKPGELIAYFQSIGMEFGADANAQTGFFNTVYNLSLPKGDQDHLEKAFTVIQDYAEGASLLENEILRERGIILAEKRERDSVSFRTFKKTLEFELPDSLFARRLPIGLESVIQGADQKLLKSYYDKWYRPDNMALIVVGDVDMKMVESMIRVRFSSLFPRSSGIPELPSTQWKEHEKTKAFYHYEPEAGSTTITIETLGWKPFEPETPESLKSDILTQISHSMLENRLLKQARDQTGGFSDVSVYSGTMLNHAFISAVHAVCEPEKWKQALEDMERALQQGLVFGFEQNELDRVKAEFLSDLEQAVDQWATQKSEDIADRLLAGVNAKKMLLSARQRKEILEPYIRSISLKDAHHKLIQSWPQDPRLIIVTGNLLLDTDDPGARILSTYTKAGLREVEKYSPSASKAFPYLEIPEAAASGIRDREDNVQGLGITTLELNNKVRLNLKATDYKQNEVLFKVCFGDGKKSEPLSKPGLSFMAESVVQKSGLGQLNADQMEEALAGRKMDIDFDVDGHHFSFSGSADPKEIELVFQLICHYLADPGFREEALDRSNVQYQQMYDGLLRKPEGIMQIKGNPFLANNDPGFGLPDPARMQAYSIKDIREWLEPYFKGAPVEISLIGDIDPEKVISLADHYLGALSPREGKGLIPAHSRQIGFPQGRQLDLKINTKIDAGVVHVAFLTDDFWDIAQTRRLNLLSKVFSEKLRLLIREELGETYSPYVYNEPSLIFDGYGVLHIVVQAKQEKHDLVYEKITDIIGELTSARISQQDLDIALRPMINHLKIYVETNEYWLNSVMADSYRYPQKLEWAKDLIRDYTAISAEELFLLAKKYLKIENRALIRIQSN
jgi:zinc protease